MSITDGARGNDQQQLRARLSAAETRANDLPARFAGRLPHALYRRFTQTAHGFTVGTPVRFNGTAWVKSQADSIANAVVLGVVVAVPHANAFIIAPPGSYISGLSGLTAGSLHYLASSPAGTLTTSPPAIPVAVLFATSATAGFLLSPQGSGSGLSALSALITITTGTSTSISGIGKARAFIISAGGGGGGCDTTGAALGYLAATSGGAVNRLLYAYGIAGAGAGGNMLVCDIDLTGLTSISHTIGAGGSAGTSGAGAGTDGAAGGDTTLTISGATLTVRGGRGGAKSYISGGSLYPGVGGLPGGDPAYPNPSTRCIPIAHMTGERGDTGQLEMVFGANRAYQPYSRGGRSPLGAAVYGFGGSGESSSVSPTNGGDGLILIMS